MPNQSLEPTAGLGAMISPSQLVYEVRPRSGKCGVDLISDDSRRKAIQRVINDLLAH
jgi:hypothetical protein